jgi:poly-gamma-glutamate synthesis protein (capsule biosynthesis protein)
MPDGQSGSITLFLCGDVMTGRGIDQILPHPSKPQLFEPYVRSARDYVRLAERACGAFHAPVDFSYIWGDALQELERMRPDARIVNLETAVTASDEAWPGKGIHYRMHPANVACLAAARIDCCVLANNHVMDWGRRGLAETLDALQRAGMHTAGAGQTLARAAAAAKIPVPGRARVLVYACATTGSGVPAEWAATRTRAGVHLLADLSGRAVESIARQVRGRKRPGDVAVLSIHWGGNWGYDIPRAERAFAHALIDAAGVDLVHGHSSHHVRGIEVHRGKLILYGCGDLLTDYEGIAGHEAYRPELSLMYFPVVDVSSGTLLRLTAVPTRVRRFRVQRAPDEGARWLADTLNREGRTLGTRVERQHDNSLELRYGQDIP